MKQLVTILFFMGIGMGVFAQPKMMQERIKAQRVALFTERLDLTPAEAEKFWPIYNAYDDKVTALKREEREKIIHRVRKTGIDNLSDSDANAMIDTMLDNASQELELRRDLIDDLRDVIPPKKIILLIKAEEDFKQRLIKILQEQRNRRNKN